MIFLCSDCGNEFEGDEYTDRCPTCGAGQDAFIIQPFNIISELEAFNNLDDEEYE